MTFLLIETASERPLIAVALDGECVEHSFFFPKESFPSAHILAKIDQCVQEANCQMADLAGIAVGVGPGSYTGIRMGAVTARALSYGTGLPLISIPSLHVFAPFGSKTCSFAVVFDAKMSGLTYIVGDYKSGHVSYRQAEQMHPLEQAAREIKSLDVILSPNFSRIGPLLLDLFPDVNLETTSPSPDRMASLAREKMQRGEYSTDGTLHLTYRVDR